MHHDRGRLATTLYLTAALWLMFVPAANAYIDAGSTTVVFQAVVAAIATGGMFFKLFWRRITGLFHSRGSSAGDVAGDVGGMDASESSDTQAGALTADASGATDQ